ARPAGIISRALVIEASGWPLRPLRPLSDLPREAVLAYEVPERRLELRASNFQVPGVALLGPRVPDRQQADVHVVDGRGGRDRQAGFPHPHLAPDRDRAQVG